MVFFLNYQGDTKRVGGEGLTDRESLVALFREKFDSSAASTDVTFEAEDKTHGVKFSVDGPSEIGDGSLVTVKVGAVDGTQERAEMKRKISALENSSNGAGSGKRFKSGEGAKFVVRLRGLPWSTSSTDIIEFFSGCNISNQDGVFQLMNREGRPTGEGYVKFDDEASLTTAIGKNRTNMGHRYIEVYKAMIGEYERVLQRERNPTSHKIPRSHLSFIIRMRGLPFSAVDEDIIDFFSEGSITPTAVHLTRDGSGRPSGEGFVEFDTEPEAKTACETMHRKTIGSRYVELFRSDLPELCAAANVQIPREYYGSAAENAQGGGAPPAQSYGPEGQDGCIQMRGLPYTASENDITKFFSQVGVMPTRIHKKQDGGAAYVEFATPVDANQAMRAHKKYIGRRYIELFRVTYNDMARTVNLPPRGPPPGANYGPPAGYGAAYAPQHQQQYGAPQQKAPVPYSPYAANGGYNQPMYQQAPHGQAPPQQHAQHW